jgi:serine/threonine-protein kinase
LEETARSRFRVVGQIGRGSIADVYLCRLQGAAGFEKDVALKRIHADHTADPLFIRMFLDEARVVAKLNHANIVQVFEVGQDEEGPYIAMEYVRGVPLAAIIARAHGGGRIHLGHAARIMAGICDGLLCAHNALDQDGKPLGIVHRDVKPTTIVVTIDGIPKLLDFGMASARGRLSNTQVAAFKKNLRYMAPEQIAQGPIDQRADVYGVGVTLYELTTGRNPFGTESDPEVQVLDRILNGEFPRPGQLMPGYPPGLEAIVMAAMTSDPGSRLPSARELRDRLEAFSTTREHSSTPTALAGWLRQLFPDFASVVKVAATPAPRTTGSRPVVGAGSGLQTPPPATLGRPAETQVTVPLRAGSSGRGSGVGWAVMAFVALGVAAAIWFYRQGSLTLPTRRTVATTPVAPTAPGGEQRAARAYLDAAETFMREQRYPLAREALAKAAEARPSDSEIEARMKRLREQIESGSTAAAARTPGSDIEISKLQPPEPAREMGRARPVDRRLAQNRAGARVRRRTGPPPPLPRAEPPPHSESPPRTASPAPPASAAAPSGPESTPAPPSSPAAPVAATTTPDPAPARPPPAPAPAPARPAARPLPSPDLPRTFISEDGERMARMCLKVEAEAIARAGVGASFAQGITAALRRRIRPNSPIFPSAMYYFIARESALGHDRASAAANLAAAQSNGGLQGAKDLTPASVP